jgi:serine/threonine-protein kinase
VRCSVGDRIDRFVLEAVVGEGGMGTVYRAYDTRLDRRVALKVVRPDRVSATLALGNVPAAGEPSIAARMLREARAAAALDHPNAVSIFDVGEVDDTVYIAMELIDGTSLRSYVGNVALPWEKKLRVLVDVARALAAAHDRGLVHRDVKPENVMVRRDGVVKVLDFGIAKRLDVDLPSGSGNSTETRRGTVVGTPRYMSPEQVRGEPVDGRSDQFTWGVVAFEMLGGAHPFDRFGEGIQLLVAIASQPTPPLAGPPDLPAIVEATLRKCMAKTAAERFSSLHEVVATLEPYMSGSMRNMTPQEGTASAPSFSTKTEMLASQLPSIETKGSAVMRSRALPRGILFGALGAAAIVAAATFVVRERNAPLNPAASAAASVTPRPSATVITALPIPTSTRPDAMAAYRAGLQAFRDAAFETARGKFERAAELEPTLAAAHLRLAMMNATVGSHQMDARRNFRSAQTQRSNLSPRDEVLLSALEPYFQSEPPDLAECERRMGAAVLEYPNDAEMHYYLGYIRLDRGELATAIPAFDRALALDPLFAQAWAHRAATQMYSGDPDGAIASIDKCLEVSPSATDCMWYATLIQDAEGKCAELETTVRRWISKDPEDYYGHRLLAKALVAQRRSLDTVRAALEQKWSRMAAERRPRARVEDELNLALLSGEFAVAERLAKEFDAMVASAPDASEHAFPALALLEVYRETAQPAKAREVAMNYLKRADAWLAPNRVEDSAIMDDPVPTLLGVLVKDSVISRAAFETRRADWVRAWQAKTSVGYKNYLWVNAYAATAYTAQDAATALDALPNFSPLPPFLQGAPGESNVGFVYLLAGRTEDALPHLRRAAASCIAFERPVGHTRAHQRLGDAYAAIGEKEAACASYGFVLSRWGQAKPRSTTADAVRSKMAQLNCPR